MGVERTLEDEKDELGLDHFEVRKYLSVLRHLRITQVSHLFLSRQTQRLREKKSGGGHLPRETGDQRASDALTLHDEEDRTQRLTRIAAEIREDQRKNAAARASHAKKRRRELEAIRLPVETLRCCIPP